MAEEIKKSDEASVPIVGLIFLGLLIYGGYKAVQYIATRGQAPPPIIALSAYFAGADGNPVRDERDPNAYLIIKGQVQRADNADTTGKVRMAVSTLDQAFSQTLIVETKGGNFETEDVSLRKLRPSDQIYIKAEFLAANASEQTPGEIYLNTRPPKVTSDTIWVITITFLLIVFIVFFYSFTGKKTPLKNRIAVIFSYCVIGIFLFLPLMAPVLLVPSDRRAMIDRPVALVLTKVGLEPDAKVQWALNIGGYAAVPQPSAQPSPLSSPTATPARTASPGATATGQPSVSPAPTSAVAESRAASPSPAQTPARTRQTTAAAPAGARTESPTPTPQVSESSDQDLIVDVQGGLVIPLYVIILSVIGGAINMTRKVPQLQEEGERSEIVVSKLKRPSLKSVWAATLGKVFSGKSSEPSTPSETHGTPENTEVAKSPADRAISPPKSPPANATVTGSGAAEDAIATEIDTKVGQLLDTYAQTDTEAQNAKSDLRDLMNKMKELFDKRPDKRPILHYDSFDDWVQSRPALKEMFTTHWRVELLSQYMYLVSAPFLAIVAYYMLQLAGLTKQPILVVISFSVGLVSERILSWLLGIASGYLRESAPQTAKN